MIQFFLDLLEFLWACAPLLFSVSILTLFFILLSKSIKKHATVYYIIFSIPFLLVLIPTVANWLGLEISGFSRLPFLGSIIRDYIHMGTFGHPLLIIIMYMGALDPKIQIVKKLFSIRKELSIISGFPILTHSLIRVTHTFPNALKFFTNNAEYMEKANVTNELGAGISNFSFVLGIVLLIIFIPLWVTSFDSIHKGMGNVKWKKLQKWAYVLYAILFIHAMGMQIGGLMNSRSNNSAPKQATAGTVATQSNNDTQSKTARMATNDGQNKGRSENNQNMQKKEPEKDNKPNQIRSFTDIKIERKYKQYIHIASLLLIYGSYLYLRLRKANRKKRKKIVA